MKNRAIIPLVVGLAVGLVAVKLGVDVVKKARAGNGNGDMQGVVVAQQLIPMGAEIKPNMLSLAKTNKALAPQGAVDDPKKLAGRVVRTQIPRGVPVIEEMLAAPGTPAGMASLVPSGYRAVAVKVDEDSSVGGFLKPGCRVDVAAVLCIRSPSGSETISKVILQDVTIGAVGQSLTGEGDTSAASLSRSVTLLVKPEEVAMLHLAATQGKIRLAMRHYEDIGAGKTQIAREGELDPDRPSEQNKKKEDGGFLSGLAKLFQREQPRTGEAPKPAWAAQLERKSVPIEVKPPFVVTMINGSNVEALAFENARSVRRVDGSKLSAPLAHANDAEPGRGDEPGRISRSDSAEPAQNAPVEPEAAIQAVRSGE